MSRRAPLDPIDHPPSAGSATAAHQAGQYADGLTEKLMIIKRALPTHPRTGLLAIGMMRDGRPIWPVLGGNGEGTPASGQDGDGGTGGTPGAGDGGSNPPPGNSTFTQADVDRIVSERLARDRARYADYDALKTKAGKFDELTEAQKTEAQKREDELLAATTRAVATEVELWKERAARKHGLDEELLQFLGGTTEAEVEERAKTLASKVQSGSGGQQGGPRLPAPDPSQGRGTGKGGAGGSVAAGRDLYQQRHKKT
ncbi:DUF4355 domain-containing protein [Sinosporangium album]|uniref:DUF4355 domain-containing protein n=1 Tax=Sinosporangium album TaxID=504805 RepID=UPI0015A4CF16|nr:DUF4355 domain-containing protein [Sinosporangium album]